MLFSVRFLLFTKTFYGISNLKHPTSCAGSSKVNKNKLIDGTTMFRGRKRKLPSSFIPEPYYHGSDSDGYIQEEQQRDHAGEEREHAGEEGNDQPEVNDEEEVSHDEEEVSHDEEEVSHDEEEVTHDEEDGNEQPEEHDNEQHGEQEEDRRNEFRPELHAPHHCNRHNFHNFQLAQDRVNDHQEVLQDRQHEAIQEEAVLEHADDPLLQANHGENLPLHEDDPEEEVQEEEEEEEAEEEEDYDDEEEDVEEEIEGELPDYQSIFNSFTKEWISTELDHTVSKVATNNF